MLHIQMPLLHVRPHHLVRNGVEAGRERRRESRHASISNIQISGNVVLRLSLQQRRGLTFHALRVGFVSVGMLKEYSVTTAKGSLPIAEDVIGETNARCRIEQVSLGATNRNTVNAALDQSIERIPDDRAACIGDQGTRSAPTHDGARRSIFGSVTVRIVDQRRLRGVKYRRIPVISVLVPVAIRSLQAHPQVPDSR